MNVKINNKKYDVPQLTFKHFTQMEEQGFSIPDAFRKGQQMLICMGFVCIVAECEREEAERLVEQHVLGGGSLGEIVNTFYKAAMESDFFRKMLGLEEEKPAKKAEVKEQTEANDQVEE